jgi:glycosyltransferase involved in cell wall biosynthesis
MRIAVLWSHLSGFLNSCLKTLVDKHGVTLFVSYQNESAEAPYDPKQFGWIQTSYTYEKLPDGKKLKEKLETFSPDVLLVASWHMKGYRYVLKQFRKKSVRVLFMDNQWLGTLKQRIGAFISPWYIQPLYEGVLLPGERQAVFAKKLGFHDSNIIRGGNSCNHPQFSAIWEKRKEKQDPYPGSFIFVGRLVESKGVKNLIDAYKGYRELCRNPFNLICCGEGDFRKELEDIEGVRVLGFVQPNEIPEKFLESSCLVLPSLFEPWGVVIHEAAASGMAIICSSACGAMVHLVQPGYNGFVVEPGNSNDLRRALIRYTDLSPNERMKMGENSYKLSLQYTPEQWTANLLLFVYEYREREAQQGMRRTT